VDVDEDEANWQCKQQYWTKIKLLKESVFFDLFGIE
jgi:hypothetical protein